MIVTFCYSINNKWRQHFASLSVANFEHFKPCFPSFTDRSQSMSFYFWSDSVLVDSILVYRELIIDHEFITSCGLLRFIGLKILQQTLLFIPIPTYTYKQLFRTSRRRIYNEYKHNKHLSRYILHEPCRCIVSIFHLTLSLNMIL